MNKQLHERLEQIAELIDPEHIKEVEALQDKVWELKPVDRIPTIMHGSVPSDYPLYSYDEVFSNPEKMLWNELLLTYTGLLLRDDRICTLRANYGPAIIPSIFGSKVIVDKATTWIEGVHDCKIIRKIIDKGMPDINTNLGAKVFETQKLYLNYLDDFKLGNYVHLVQADTQSPFDITAMIWGNEIYYAMYDEPELVHELLDLVTKTIIEFIVLQKQILHEQKNSMYHWWYKVPAGARIVDDMSITLSAKMYEEFVKPYNDRVFQAFGNGYMHYCGHGLQSQHLRLHTYGLKGIEMAAANVAENIWEYNLDSIWKQAYEHNVNIIWCNALSLPEKRPDIPSGLIYLHNSEKLPFEQAATEYKLIKEFWS